MPEISAVILTRDDDQDLARSIRSVLFTNEVLVIHSGASDRVFEVSRPLGARVVKRTFAGDGFNDQWAVAEATHDWVLCLEAGEEVTPELAIAVRALLVEGEPPCAAYEVRLVTLFMGRLLSCGAGSRVPRVRLFDRRRVERGAAPAPGAVVTSGTVGHLAGTISHHAVRDVSDAIARLNTESTFAATGIAMTGRRPGGLTLMLAAARQFLHHYVVRSAFRSGFPGLAWSLLKAMTAALTYMKAHELVTDAALVTEPRHTRVEKPPGAGGRSLPGGAARADDDPIGAREARHREGP